MSWAKSRYQGANERAFGTSDETAQFTLPHRTRHHRDQFREPGVHGAVLTEALASRFAAQIQVSTDYDLARALGIDSQAVRAAQNLATRQANGEIGWAPQLRELIAYQRIARVLSPDAAIANLVGSAPEEDRDEVAAAVASAFGKARVTPLALGRQV
jgi:nitric oxide reductase NorQ protein